jgi:hypothetical protein
LKTKLQIELENAYITIMNVLKNNDVCLVNQRNKRTLQFFKSSALWIVKDEIGVCLCKHFAFKESVEEFMKV